MCIAAALVGVAAVGVGMSMSAAEDAEDAQYEAAQEQKKANNATRAQNEASAMQERRKQLREERIKRARVLATSSSSGTAGSSGEIGAIGSLSTGLSSNLGFNQGALNTASDISMFSQNAANFMSDANKLGAESQMWGQISSLAMTGASMFGGGGKAPESGASVD